MLHKRVLLSALWLIAVLCHSQGLAAQDQVHDDDTPIIAVADSDIYAVSPVDGSARLLVDRDGEWDREIVKTQASWESPVLLSRISPTYDYVAYTAPLTKLRDAPYNENYDLLFLEPNDLTLIEIATGTQTSITHQGLTLADSVAKHVVNWYSMPTWSADGRRLYFKTLTLSLINRVPQTLIEYYDVVSGERGTFLDLKGQGGVVALYAFHEGLVVLRRVDTERLELTLYYQSDGAVVMKHELSIPNWDRGLRRALITMNLNRNGSYYGFFAANEQPTLLHITSGNVTSLEGPVYPAITSDQNPMSPLRLVWTDLYGEEEWSVVDVNGEAISSINLPLTYPELPAILALSPQGEAVAYVMFGGTLDPDPIQIADSRGTRELGFNATQIQWGTFDYDMVTIIPEFRG